MKVAIITDQHFGVRNDSPQFLDYYEKFYKDTFFPTLDNESISTVLVLGDTFDRRKYVNFNTLKRAKEMFFDELERRNIHVIMIVGNHDTFFKNTNDVNSVDLLLENYKNITVIENAKTIKIDGLEVCMLPWICAENYADSINEIKNTKASICMGHLEIAGFAMYRGMHSDEGLDRGLFDKFEYTFSGHYHHKHNFGSIYYLGNPYELTWQDYADPRGFHIFDFNTFDVLTFIQNPNSMFHKIMYDDKAESVIDINAKDLSKYTDTHVKVVVVNKTNPYLFEKFVNRLYQINPADVTIAEDFSELTEELNSDTIDQADDTLSILNKYVDTINEDHIDNSKLKNIFKELYVEALNPDTE